MSLVQERERRANAGSRMRALLNQEEDMEELFEYKEDDEEDTAFSVENEAEEEDKVDSDFDLDSSEGEQEHIEEGRQLDKQIALDEKRARRTVTMTNITPRRTTTTTTTTTTKPATEKRKRPKTEESAEERTIRYSSRKNTILNRILVEDQLREHEKRRALLPKRDRPVVNKLTQEELLAEAAITEETNKNSLLEWQQKEAERKENAKKTDKKTVAGPCIRYHSFTDKLQVKEGEDPDAMGRTLMTFIEEDDLQEYDPEERERQVGIEQYGMIHYLAEWFEKLPKPNKPIVCPINGDLAKYRDPSSGVPYANVRSYQAIKTCLSHETRWSPISHLYLGRLPGAKGVPEGFDA